MSASAITTGEPIENRWPNSTSQEGINTTLSANFESISVDRYLNCKTSEGRVVPLAAVVEEIRNPMAEVQALIGEIRSSYKSNGGGKAGKDAIRSLKSALPAVTFNAGGSRQECTVSNGIVSVDLDELGQRLSWARDHLKADPHCLFVFTSPSGDGLKALIKVPKAIGDEHQMRQQHRRNFLAVREYLRASYALEIDPAASDILRLCYLSHDPDCELVYSARELEVEKYLPADGSDPDDRSADPDAKEGADAGETVDSKIVQALLDSIPPHPDYQNWIRISAAVRNSLGNTNEAVEMLKKWSPEEHKGEYASLFKATTFKRIGFGTLHYYARQNSFDGVLAKCFYLSNGRYLFDIGDKYLPLSAGDLRKHLAPFKIGARNMDEFLCRIRMKNLVDLEMDVAGHHRGIHQFQQLKFLVKNGPRIIQAKPGGTGFINRFVSQLLGDDQQYSSFMSWIQFARKNLLTGQRGQVAAMTLAGDAGDGKSLLIEIVRQALGGRSANAHKFLSGESRFNKDLVGAELLYIDDNAASKDHTTTSRFAQNLKAFLFSSSVSIEGKKVDSIEFAPVQALIMAVNSETQHLRVLPELDESMKDKLMLLKTNPSRIPNGLAGDIKKIQAMIREDLPGWLYLVENFESTPWVNQQTGRLVCFQNPDLLQMLAEVSPEGQLLELMKRTRLKFSKGRVVTAVEVAEILFGEQNTSHPAKRLLSWTGACGTLLAKLARRGDGLVTRGSLTRATRIRQYVLNLEETEEPSDHSKGAVYKFEGAPEEVSSSLTNLAVNNEGVYCS